MNSWKLKFLKSAVYIYTKKPCNTLIKSSKLYIESVCCKPQSPAKDIKRDLNEEVN